MCVSFSIVVFKALRGSGPSARAKEEKNHAEDEHNEALITSHVRRHIGEESESLHSTSDFQLRKKG